MAAASTCQWGTAYSTMGARLDVVETLNGLLQAAAPLIKALAR
ncbi:hypothetical protein BLL52_3417 [Rhodoferax antarcticus ANT.BR]|uniref:Uncharacterized protein n=1 Tax=Rhodoferax antarcticus ANT.BR TaxID=1111071 RepID=A0A1Q8YBC9_9BURK|nr:hypothetical protein BLL52_3417 [Rhodoferax antarcticus ANT.BR]